jgi:hypothetical protein
VGTAEAAKILERAGAGRRRCHTGSIAGASVNALGGCLSAVAVGQRVCGRTCADGNDHRGVDSGRVRQSLSNDQTILLSVLVCASRDVDGQRVIGERNGLAQDQMWAEFAACFASHNVFLLKNQGQRCLTPAPMVHPVLSGSVLVSSSRSSSRPRWGLPPDKRESDED